MKISSFCFLLCIAVVSFPAKAIAQTEDDVVSSEDIVRSLNPPKTRSLFGSRGFDVTEKPKVDLNIPFERNSSVLAPEAEKQLEQLGTALLSGSLAENRFQIAGHTDASGTADYNRQLSDKRANTVKQFLLDRGISADRLDSIGYGEDKLLVTDDPYSADNRRVEVTNLGPAGE